MDLDVVAGGEPADHEEAEPVAVEEVEVLGPGDAGVGLGEALPAHAEPPVLDLQDVAVADGFTTDPHLGVGRGELGGVLDEFGQEVGEVGDGAADDGPLGEPGHLHARVVLDLGDGGADDVGEGDGSAPGAAGRGAGEDDQALRVAPHAGGEVVEPEEVVELAGVVGTPFHGVQEGELAVDEDLAAAGEVDEDAGDAVGEFGAFDGGGEGRAVDGGEGLADLADLVLGVGRDRRFGADVDLLAGAQPAHGGGEFAARDAEGGVAEGDELDDEAAPDPYGDEEGGPGGHEAEDTAAPPVVRALPAKGSVRSAAPARASVSIAASPSRTAARGAFQSVGVTARAAGRPGVAARIRSSARVSRAWSAPVASRFHAARSAAGRSAVAEAMRVRRVSTAPEKARSRSAVSRPVRRAEPRRASSRDSISPARPNSRSTRASAPRSASWTPVRAPPTAKAAEITSVYSA